MALTGGKELTGFLGSLGFHAPFLGAQHVHGGVEGLEFRFNSKPAHLILESPPFSLEEPFIRTKH
jgi:hypothetical protein